MMSFNEMRKRTTQAVPQKILDMGAGASGGSKEPHPAGEVKHGGAMQLVRMLAFTAWFLFCCTFIFITQAVGAPLYFWNREYYYAYMALTKQAFGVVITTITQWFSPTLIRISWDADLKDQFRQLPDGRLQTAFPERMILIANHQIYTDWLYHWWIAYTSRLHGYVYIILRDDLKYIPIIGTGMMFYGFIFMARKWASDKPRLQHRLEKLKTRQSGRVSGSAEDLDPMWLMIFPEGTNLSANTRRKNKAYAEKAGIQDMTHQLLPRSTGLLFCLQELKGTVEWVYDCTVAYEGTPRDGYAQDIFTLRSTYFQGRPPASVNMHWRRFAVSDIPLDDPKAFEAWLTGRWREKDGLLEHFYSTGVFPSTKGPSGDKGYIDTEVQLSNWFEILQIFIVPFTVFLIVNVAKKLAAVFS